MNNPNHPLYNALGGNSNLHLLDNMLFATDQGKQNVIQQYTYPMESLAAHQHAMNLAVSGHAVAATTIDSSALIYQQNDNHQQQPISYKIPQVGTGLILQHQHHQPQHHQQQQHHSQHQMVSNVGTITSLQDKKKDIVAQAMREEKIFEELNQRSDPMPSTQHHTIIAKKTTPLGLIAIPANLSGSQVINSPHNPHQQHTAEPQASHSSFSHSTAKQMTAFKTSEAQLQSTPMTLSNPSGGVMTARSVNLSRNKLSVSRQIPQRQQQIVPRLQLFEDEDDGLTCRMCLQPFWYRSQLLDHLRNSHSVLDPERYEREERDKKVRRQREEQQRIAIAKQQRLVASSAALRGILPSQSSSLGGRGVTIGMSRGGASSRVGGGVGSRGGRGANTSNRLQVAGPRPSFQYRDGSFICDLCKRSFSDGNDMVAHWKQHVKQQQGNVMSGRGRGGRGRGRGSSKTHTTSRGRPITGKQAGKAARVAKRKNRKDKGKPKWSGYLLWSTRKRKELAAEQSDLNFAQISRLISEGWREVTPEEHEALKLEAEELNSRPREEFDSGEEDLSDLEFDDEDENIDQIFDEFEQEQLEESKSSGVGRKRGRKPGQKYPRVNYSDDEYSLDQDITQPVKGRKKLKYSQPPQEEEGDTDSDDELEDSDSESEPNDDEDNKQARKGLTLPLKKRGRPPSTLDPEIKKAIKAALAAKPIVVPIGGLPKEEQKPDCEAKEDATSIQNESISSRNEKQVEALEGSVTEEDPPENVFDDENEGGSKDNLVGETTNPDISSKSKNDRHLNEEHPSRESASPAALNVEDQLAPLNNEVDHDTDQYKSLIDDTIF